MVSPDEAVAVASARPTPTAGHLIASALTDAECDASMRVLKEDQLATDTPPSRGKLHYTSPAPESDATEKPGLTMVKPDEAIARALPVPKPEEVAIPGMTDEEWDAFVQALAEC